MPEIGEVKRGKDIWPERKYSKNKFVWATCIDCGNVRWVKLRKGHLRSLRCFSCAMAKVNQRKRVIPITSQAKPLPGEIRHGCDIGKKPGNGKFIWTLCTECGTGRWLTEGKPLSNRCAFCWHKYQRLNGFLRSREKCPTWKGGRTIRRGGYIGIHLTPDDPFFSMADKDHYVYEHRLVMAKQLGRCLFSWEIVHHKHTKYPQGSKEDKGDNRPENLKVVTDDEHKQISILEAEFNKRINELESRITLLESENVLLRTQLEGNPHFTIE